MAGDVVQTAAEYSGGQFDSDAVLKWLANIVRTLRTESEVPCGHAGTFSSTEEKGTVEINPLTKHPVPGYARKTLAFEPSEQLNAVIGRDVVTEEILHAFDSADPISSCFGRALATILITDKRAAIGNFGSWSIGQKPNMQQFIRFRPKAAINRML